MTPTEQPKSNFLAAGALLSALEPVVEEFGTSTPLTYVITFLHVVAAGSAGIDQGELGKKLDTSGPAAVRAVQALSDWSWVKGDDAQKQPGLGLVKSETDPRGDARRRVVSLTNKGDKLAQKIAAKLERRK